jgi:CRISPR-associated protein Csh1
MIHQFAELGRYFLERDSVTNPLEQLAQNPGSKFGPNVLLLIFGEDGFERVQPESYDEDHRLRYLYRAGPPNKWDATATAGLPQPKPGKGPDVFLADLHTRLARLGNSIRDALERGENISATEIHELEKLSNALPDKSRSDDAVGAVRQPIIGALQAAHPDPKQRAFLSVAWRSSDGSLKYVGDYEAFRQQVLRAGGETQSVAETNLPRGQCCICGASAISVFGEVQVPNFKFYTLDKPGSVSGGFDRDAAWRNFPVCADCRTRLDFSGERVKRELAFKFYGFSYVVLPSAVKPASTQAFEFLRHLTHAKVDNTFSHRLKIAEDDIFAVIAAEDNRLQVDLLFYQPDPQSFRPALYISGLLPSRFQELLRTKEAVDAHSWLRVPSPKTFTKDTFTFGSLRKVFPSKAGGSTFDDDFLAATRAALEKRPFPFERLLAVGMQLVQQDHIEGKGWAFRLADLFRSLLFFEHLLSVPQTKPSSDNTMSIPNYGDSPQANRVTALFATAPNRLRTEVSAQAAFLLGACCGRVEDIQSRVNRQFAGSEAGKGASPFAGKYKAFRLNQPDMERLFVEAKDKARAYGHDEESKVANLLKCAGAALFACSDRWPLSPDEISYFFALGHALRSRLAERGGKENDSDSSDSQQNQHPEIQ